ncbi:MAG: sigma-70 family RNA polymerase sigma factor [Holophagales bacterium]|nr:sigma-70 family RNA polymerase sigma factor [Holophagales bacterium]
MLEQPDLTRLLRRWSAGDAAAFDALMEATYTRLHRIARSQAKRERGGHTLAATGLLHEAVLRLMDIEGLSWSDRGHFYAAAAQMMRRILVDYAREQNRLKRGGDAAKVTLDEASCLAEDGRPADLEALDDALAHLEARDPRKARIVELRFFAGLTGEEIARCLEISPPTVQREWRRARTWLYLEMKGESLGG